jgi:hypothetical protein
MKFSDDDEAWKDEWPTQIDAGLPARRLAPDDNFSGRRVHVDPAAFLMASAGVGRLGILPGVFERT